MTTNIHYLIAGMAVLLVVIWQYSRQRQMDDRNSRMFRRLLSVVSLDVAAELVSTGFILYAPYSFNVCRMLSNTVFYLFQALLPLLLLYYVCTLCTSRVIAPSVVLRMGIPTIALVCIILTNPFTEMLFYFDGTGYRHGPWYLLLYVSALLHIAGAAIFVAVHRASVSRRNLASLFAVFALAALGIAAQAVNPSVLTTGFGLSLSILAMYFGSSMGVKRLADEGIDAAFLPFFGQDGQKWLMTTPYFQVALSRNLEQDSARRAKAMQVLHVMLSEDAQNRIVYEGQDLLSYSQNVGLRLTDYLEDVRPVVEQNHMYIRIASNDFFAVSKDVVSRMIAGEYTAKQAYQAFNAQLLADDTDTAETVLTSDKGYSNVFHADGGNASFSVMANTLRGVYGSDVLIAAANSFTGSVLAADYTEKQAASMIMPNGLLAYRRTMTGAELTETVRAFVEGSEDGFTPFNRGSLPAVSGIAIEVKEENGGFALTGVTRDGKPLQGDETVTVTCLATAKQMAPLLADDSRPFEGGDAKVRDTWSAYAAGGSAALAEPEHYITLR